MMLERVAGRGEIVAKRRQVSEEAPVGKIFVTSSLATQILIKSLVQIHSTSQRDREKLKGAMRPFICFLTKDFCQVVSSTWLGWCPTDLS
jgi:hypothetical protein